MTLSIHAYAKTNNGTFGLCKKYVGNLLRSIASAAMGRSGRLFIPDAVARMAYHRQPLTVCRIFAAYALAINGTFGLCQRSVPSNMHLNDKRTRQTSAAQRAVASLPANSSIGPNELLLRAGQCGSIRMHKFDRNERQSTSHRLAAGAWFERFLRSGSRPLLMPGKGMP
jgi:hypothetical protein